MEIFGIYVGFRSTIDDKIKESKERVANALRKASFFNYTLQNLDVIEYVARRVEGETFTQQLEGVKDPRQRGFIEELARREEAFTEPNADIESVMGQVVGFFQNYKNIEGEWESEIDGLRREVESLNELVVEANNSVRGLAMARHELKEANSDLEKAQSDYGDLKINYTERGVELSRKAQEIETLEEEVAKSKDGIRQVVHFYNEIDEVDRALLRLRDIQYQGQWGPMVQKYANSDSVEELMDRDPTDIVGDDVRRIRKMVINEQRHGINYSETQKLIEKHKK